jgi:hypothetical protein
MPLDLSILKSRDPDGRIAQAIKKGEKVKSSDYDALVAHSSKFLGSGTTNTGEDAGAAFARIKTQNTSANKGITTKEHSGYSFNVKNKRAHISRPPSTTLERQQDIDDKVAKRRAKRLKRKK